MVVDQSLLVTVNGEARRMPSSMSIADMVRELGFDPARVAVERNLQIVPRASLSGARIEEGDSFEIVRFVGGG